MSEQYTHMHIDLETFGERNITKGLHQYAEHSEILLAAVKYNDGPTVCFDIIFEDFPEKIVEDLQNPNVIKWAHNAAFEINELEIHLGIKLDPSQWRCTMDLCYRCGLPGSLGQAGKVVGLDVQKDKIGGELIKLFCVPQNPTAKNGNKTRIYPWDRPKEWKQFRQYCITDVEVEYRLSRMLSFYTVSQAEHRYWVLDFLIGRNGILIDRTLAENALELNSFYREKLIEEAKQITGLQKPNSIKKLVAWLNEELENEGEDLITALNKKTLPDIIAGCSDSVVLRVLTLRQELSKTSVQKYKSMLHAVSRDGRLRYSIQHHGAGRTGRAAGRVVQPHNMPKTVYKNLDYPRRLVYQKDGPHIELCYGAIPMLLSKLIRTAFIAPKGYTFGVGDFASIEARLIAWLAGERWRLEAFEKGTNIYSASASMMFDIPIEEIPKGCPTYDKGKIAELALGYNGSKGALLNMGAEAMGLVEDELLPIVYAWRDASPNIVKLWKTFDTLCKEAIKTGERQTAMYGISFEVKYNFLFITLPSGRRLSYFNPKIEYGERGSRITYMGMNQETNKWSKLDTYGGKLTENIVQAIARDLLYCAIERVHNAGFKIVLHVHDEIVVECRSGESKRLEELMVLKPNWAAGLPMGVEVFESDYYKK